MPSSLLISPVALVISARLGAGTRPGVQVDGISSTGDGMIATSVPKEHTAGLMVRLQHCFIKLFISRK